MRLLQDPTTPPPAAELAEGLREEGELQPGTEGASVLRLQQALVALGYLTQDQVQSGPGIFGPKTTQALKLLQEEWRLAATGTLCAQTRDTLRNALLGTPPPGGWSGRRAAPGTADVRHWIAASAPTHGPPTQRSGPRYEAVLEQFAVEHNPRYAPRDGNTYGHIFVWDVTSAMGVEIPHWADPQGNPAAVGAGRELVANDVPLWLEAHGARRGWRSVPGPEAQRLASLGHPVVACAPVTGGARLAMVRPGEAHPQGPWVAMAGGRPQARVLSAEALGGSTGFWVNDGAVDPVAVRAGEQEPEAVRGRELRRGDSGQDVLWAQEALVALGDLSRAEMSTGPGAFGPRTELAVKAFQQKAGVPATGAVGVLTRSAINVWLKRASEPAARSPGVVLERGSQGREVWSLQNALLRVDLLDWDGFVTSPGIYGPRTEAAIRSLQLRFGHPPSGTFGPRTHELLEQALARRLPAVADDEEPILGAERAIAFAMNPPPNEGPAKGSWHGCAMALVREAYRSSAKVKGPLSEERPQDAFRALQKQGRVSSDGVAPRGALAFFSFGKGGYVGISLGDGRYVGASTSGPPSQVRPLWTRTFLGWAVP